MKRKVLLALALTFAGILVLTACTSSEQGNVQPSGAQNTNPGTQTGTGTQTSNGQGTLDQSTGTVSGGEAVFSVDGTEDAQESMQQAAGIPDGNAGAADDGEPAGEVIPDEAAAEAENDMADPYEEGSEETEDDGWSGTYIADEKKVTLKKIDDGLIRFAFFESEMEGISGIAEIKESQAIYKGDDHHVVIFTVDHDAVDVAVTSEEDYDASGSPLIGHYVKER